MQAYIHPTLNKLLDGIRHFQQRAYDQKLLNMLTQCLSQLKFHQKQLKN